jgi:hypothetical protein
MEFIHFLWKAFVFYALKSSSFVDPWGIKLRKSSSIYLFLEFVYK